MNHLWNLIRKELKELLTPVTLISIIVVAVLFASLGSVIGSETEKMTEPTRIAVVNLDDSGEAGVSYHDYYSDAVDYIGGYYDLLTGGTAGADYIIEISGTVDLNDPDGILRAMDGAGAGVMFVFHEDYSKNIDEIANSGGTSRGVITVYYNGVGTGVFGAVSTAVVDMVIGHINFMTSVSIIDGAGATNPVEVQSPVGGGKSNTVFNGKIYPYSPAEISGALQSQSMLMPLLIMIVIAMIGGMIISSMGNEKENKTLETLLTLPVKRTTIVSGKLMGSAIAGLIFGVVYLAGMYFYTNSLSANALSLENLGLTLSLTDWGIVAAMVFLAILSALGICMILGAFVKNFKAAQTLTLPISVLAMIPMFVTMFTDFNTLPTAVQAFIFAIPFSHPMMVMNNLMLGNTVMIWAGLAYLVLFAIATIYITVRIYNSDILLTGLPKRKKKLTFPKLRKQNV